eukprot:SAG11_NODE_29009_length_315_cov_1.157407_1_plen_22_part_10
MKSTALETMRPRAKYGNLPSGY